MAKRKDPFASPFVPMEEQPYSIPENWCWTKLDKIVSIVTGKKDANYGSKNGIYPFFTCAAEPICCNGYSFEGKSLLLPGNGANVGQVTYYDGKFEAYQRTYVLQVLNSALNLKYVFYHILGFWENYNRDKQYGSATNYIKMSNFTNYPIAIAPIAEQHRIVDRIESLFVKLDEAKEKAQAVVDEFELRKSAILYKAFTGKLTARWRKEHGIGLDSWETVELSRRFDIVGGVQKKPSRSPKDNPIPYLTVANVFRDRIDLSEIRYFEVFNGELDKLRLQEKDILVVEGNGSGNEIGRCAMWRCELPVCIHQNHIIRLRATDSDTIPEYVLYFLNSSTGKSIMKERAKTTAGLFNLSTGKIRTIPVPFATVSEQVEIIHILDRLLNKEQQAKSAAEAVLDRIDTMKKAILARAFRGELGTNDPAEEWAGELVEEILK